MAMICLEPRSIPEFRKAAQEIQGLTAKPANFKDLTAAYQRAKEESLAVASLPGSTEYAQEVARTDKLVQDRLVYLSKCPLDQYRLRAQEIQSLTSKPVHFQQMVNDYIEAQKTCLETINKYQALIGHEYAQEIAKTDKLVQDRLVYLSQSYTSYLYSFVPSLTWPVSASEVNTALPHSLVEEMRRDLSAKDFLWFKEEMEACQANLIPITDVLGQGPFQTLMELNDAFTKAMPKEIEPKDDLKIVSGAEEYPVVPKMDVKDVSLIVGSLIPRIEQSCAEEGIYRVSGQHITVSRALHDLAQNARAVTVELPIHDLTSLLKNLVGLLKEPLLPFDLIKGSFYPNVNEDALKNALKIFSPEKHELLKKIIVHLNKVNQHVGQNKMTSYNLAVCFTPSIFSDGYCLSHSVFMNKFVAHLIDHPELLNNKSIEGK